MITYKTHRLANGLTVIANRDTASQLAAVNILYKVGARDEEPQHTGFAHLFEHLMFRGTENIPDFDTPVQRSCGDNNAFTNNDYTDYYITLPKDNIETALWLESDRMTGLNIDQEKLELEKRVVIEEFHQRYLNQPYGDRSMLVRDMVYKVHPYRWATIGLTPDHIASATLDHVKAFYANHYRPSNAILSVSANLDYYHVFELTEKWFAGVKDHSYTKPQLPMEPIQIEARRIEVERDVPATSVTIAFPLEGGRLSQDHYMADMITDILAGGESGRLYQSLVKNRQLFGAVNAYITGDIDPGMVIVVGQLLPETSVEQAEEAMWQELRELQEGLFSDYEVEKVKNKFEAGTLFGELNVMNKAMNLGYYEMLGDLALINRETDIYRAITTEQIRLAAQNIFRVERSNTLIYRAK